MGSGASSSGNKKEQTNTDSQREINNTGPADPNSWIGEPVAGGDKRLPFRPDWKADKGNPTPLEHDHDPHQRVSSVRTFVKESNNSKKKKKQKQTKVTPVTLATNDVLSDPWLHGSQQYTNLVRNVTDNSRNPVISDSDRKLSHDQSQNTKPSKLSKSSKPTRTKLLSSQQATNNKDVSVNTTSNNNRTLEGTFNTQFSQRNLRETSAQRKTSQGVFPTRSRPLPSLPIETPQSHPHNLQIGHIHETEPELLRIAHNQNSSCKNGTRSVQTISSGQTPAYAPSSRTDGEVPTLLAIARGVSGNNRVHRSTNNYKPRPLPPLPHPTQNSHKNPKYEGHTGNSKRQNRFPIYPIEEGTEETHLSKQETKTDIKKIPHREKDTSRAKVKIGRATASGLIRQEAPEGEFEAEDPILLNKGNTPLSPVKGTESKKKNINDNLTKVKNKDGSESRTQMGDCESSFQVPSDDEVPYRHNGFNDLHEDYSDIEEEEGEEGDDKMAALDPEEANKAWSDWQQNYCVDKDNLKLNDNLKFYTNEIRFTPGGDKIIVVLQKWKGDFKRLEYNHSYIQWLFPMPENSGMNYNAQALQFHEAQEIMLTPRTNKRVIGVFRMMMAFYGFDLKDKVTGKLERSEDWKARFDHLNGSIHNYRRLSRIITSVGALGYPQFQASLVNILIDESYLYHTLPRLQSSIINHYVPAVLDDAAKEMLYGRCFNNGHPNVVSPTTTPTDELEAESGDVNTSAESDGKKVKEETMENNDERSKETQLATSDDGEMGDPTVETRDTTQVDPEGELTEKHTKETTGETDDEDNKKEHEAGEKHTQDKVEDTRSGHPTEPQDPDEERARADIGLEKPDSDKKENPPDQNVNLRDNNRPVEAGESEITGMKVIKRESQESQPEGLATF